MQTLSARLPIDLMAQQKQTQRETTPFGTWLKTTRNERGMTLEAVADRADTAQPVVTNLERGTRNPSRNMVARLARALMPSDADIESSTYHRLLNAGLKSAGFLPEADIDSNLDSNLDGKLADAGVLYAAAYNGLGDEEKEIILGLIKKFAKGSADHPVSPQAEAGEA